MFSSNLELLLYMFSVDNDTLHDLKRAIKVRKLALIADCSLILRLHSGSTDCPRKVPFVPGTHSILIMSFIVPALTPEELLSVFSVFSPMFPVTGFGFCMFGWTVVTEVMLCSH